MSHRHRLGSCGSEGVQETLILLREGVGPFGTVTGHQSSDRLAQHHHRDQQRAADLGDPELLEFSAEFGVDVPDPLSPTGRQHLATAVAREGDADLIALAWRQNLTRGSAQVI